MRGQTDTKFLDMCRQTDTKFLDMCGQTDTKILDMCGQTEEKFLHMCGQTDTFLFEAFVRGFFQFGTPKIRTKMALSS